MSESERVQRWRQRQREAGKEPLTIWLTTAEKLHLEDMALKRHCSPSELVQHALALLRGESLPVTATVPDMEQLRAMVQQELAKAQTVTDTVTDTVAATLHQTLPALVRALLQEQQAGIVTDTVSDTLTVTSLSPSPGYGVDAAPGGVSDTVTDTVSATSTSQSTDHTAEPVLVCVSANVTDTGTDTDAAPPAKRKAPTRQRHVTADVSDNVTVIEPPVEPFDTTKYRLGKLCPRNHDYQGTGQSLLRRTNRHCCACDREKFHERKQAKRQQKERV